MRSASLTIPVMVPVSSTTGIALTLRLIRSLAASSTEASGPTESMPSDITSFARMTTSFALRSDAQPSESRLVGEDDGPAGAGQPDQAVAHHLRQGAGHGLDGQAEMVGDVGALHRQLGLVGIGATGGNLEQEARHLLERVLAAEQDHMIVRALEVAQHR